MGEDEWLEGRITPAMKYRKDNPDAPIAFLCDAGHGHFDYSDELIDYLNLFISKAVKNRLPKSTPLNMFPILSAVDPKKDGWWIDGEEIACQMAFLLPTMIIWETKQRPDGHLMDRW